MKDWSFFFEIFSFVICANKFALAGTCGGQELDFFKSAGVDIDSLFYLFKIFCVVGDYFYTAERV